MSPESLSGGQVTRQERYGTARPSGYRAHAVADDGEPRNGAPATALEAAGPEKPRLPSLDPAAPPEPVFAPSSWLDSEATTVLADHPLLRGLLLELPPKGSSPPPDWLDRWFEATRSILELLYVR